MKTYRETIDYLYGLIRLGIRPGMRRINKLVSVLGDPHLSYPTIIVAGTNGKGSTSAAITSILTEAGLKTGLYTSPHLERFNERISVSGRPISDRDVVTVAGIVREASEDMPRTFGRPTFFETATAMAFLYFQRQKVDIAVLEVGMGGRLDATNVAEPVVSVITTVGVDHAHHLGSSERKIAGEKAGIIKPGAIVVTGVTEPGPLGVITRAAKEAGAPMLRMNREFDAKLKRAYPAAAFDYLSPEREIRGLKFSLAGAHQAGNAAVAVAACTSLASSKAGIDVPVSAVRRGLKNTRWPGRLEVINRGGRAPMVVLDSAHNPDGASVLAGFLKARGKKRLVLAVGIMKDKDAGGILAPLLPMADLVIATAPKNPRSTPPAELAELAERAGARAMTRPTVARACREALECARPSDIICVTGSIFTVGEARTYLRRALGPA